MIDKSSRRLEEVFMSKMTSDGQKINDMNDTVNKLQDRVLDVLNKVDNLTLRNERKEEVLRKKIEEG